MDLSIITGGSLFFECLYNGIPSFVFNISQNQTKVSKDWRKFNNEKFSINYKKKYNKQIIIQLRAFLRLSYNERKLRFSKVRNIISNNLILKKIKNFSID